MVIIFIIISSIGMYVTITLFDRLTILP